MKLYIFALVIGLIACNRSIENDLKPVELSDKNENRILFLNFLDSISEFGKQNPKMAINILNEKLDNSRSKSERIDIIFQRGKFYSDLNQLDSAINDLNTVVYYNEYPECLVARATVFLKLNRHYNAQLDLKKAVSLNNSYNWHLGNFYEIIGDTLKAIESYRFLYISDQNKYNYCHERIECLKSKSCPAFSEIQSRNNSQIVLELNTDINVNVR